MAMIIVRVAVIVGAVSLALAGCGSDAKTATAGSPSSNASVAAADAPVSLPGTVNEPKTGDATGGSIDVVLGDFFFGPSFIKVKSGQTVTLTIKNEGTSPHTFTSAALSIDETLQPGQSAEKAVTLPSATAFSCTFHQGLGMQGAFFVKEGDTVASAESAGATTTTSDSYYN
jgi:plastocyanin